MKTVTELLLFYTTLVCNCPTPHFYISNDKEHDSTFVQHYIFLHLDWVLDVELMPKEHWVYIDGCSA
jgi:hypothetical protein